MISRRILLASLVVLLSLYTSRAVACSCAPPGDPMEEIVYSTDVFVGEVTRVKDSQPPDTWWSRLLWRLGMGPDPTVMSTARPIHYTFKVSDRFMGTGGDTTLVVSAASESSCGYHFQQGREYVVYATERMGELWAGRCSRTGPSGDPASGLEWLRANRERLSRLAID